MAAKRNVLSALATSGLGVAAAVGTANNASALNHLLYSGTDFLSSMAQKSAGSSSGFYVTGGNSVGVTTAYTYRSGSSIYAKVYSQGGSAFARAYARCQSSIGPYSAVYSDWTVNSTYKVISCDSLPDLNGGAAGNGWTLANWGAVVVSNADANVPKVTRRVCDGQGCTSNGIAMPVASGFAGCAGLPSGYTKTLIGGDPAITTSVAGPAPGVCCW